MYMYPTQTLQHQWNERSFPGIDTNRQSIKKHFDSQCSFKNSIFATIPKGVWSENRIYVWALWIWNLYEYIDADLNTPCELDRF